MQPLRSQFKRILFVDREIRKGEFPNAPDMAKKYEMNAKTIKRDIVFMKEELGAPIAYNKQEHGYYYTEQTFSLPSVYLGERDIFSIFLAEQAMRAYKNTPLYPQLVKVFKKIGAMLTDKVQINPDYITGKLSYFPEPMTRIGVKIWDKITKALHDEVIIEIVYKAAGYTKAEKKRVEPYHLMGFRGNWYLLGRCLAHKEKRLYSLARMKDVKVTNEMFAFPDELDVRKGMDEQFGIFDGLEEYKIRIWFSDSIAPFIKERVWHKSQQIVERKDGSLIVSMTVNHLLEVTNWILSWGSDAKVLAPAPLVAEVKKKLKANLRAYKK